MLRAVSLSPESDSRRARSPRAAVANRPAADEPAAHPDSTPEERIYLAFAEWTSTVVQRGWRSQGKRVIVVSVSIDRLGSALLALSRGAR